MQKHPELTDARIRQVQHRIEIGIHSHASPLRATVAPSAEPTPFEALSSLRFRPIAPGDVWGHDFECAWFRLEGRIPTELRGEPVVALVDVGGEACVVDRRGRPLQGLTNVDAGGVTRSLIQGKRRVHLTERARGGEPVELLLDAGANGIFGAGAGARLREASIARFSPTTWRLYHQYAFLAQLARALPEGDRQKGLLRRALNDVCNLFDDADEESVRRALDRLAPELDRPATASALEVTAIGHAHIDVAWLWPLRETVRKAARTFSTALTMIEEYPDYRFGASQPQLYQFVKDHHPELHRRIRDAVQAGRWEPQGAMWVEPDTNIPSGESLVRQLLYGRRYFRDEFGVDVDNLWLPDVFGYAAQLPQILVKSGVDHFMTQKISWNQFNRFPHHTFWWEGLDGSRVFSHFLPAENYSVSGTADQWREMARNHLDADRSAHALALFGVGDGGGGPGRTHIEFTRLAADIEGLPRVRMAFARDFFATAAAEARDLMVWRGELYLEYHRGTYTTQAHLKRMNRRLEQRLRDLEWLATAAGGRYPHRHLERLWKTVLLHQFHDIIPGSSIRRVNEEAHEQYRRVDRELDERIADAASAHARRVDTRGFTAPEVVRNTLSWSGPRWVTLPGRRPVRDSAGTEVPSQVVTTDRGPATLARLDLPSMGHVTVDRRGRRTTAAGGPSARADRLQNQRVKVAFRGDGSIRSIRDTVRRREVLTGPGNRLLLYEDRPLNWDAWDVDRFYLERPPRALELVSAEVVEDGPLRVGIAQHWRGEGCDLLQRIRLYDGDSLIEFDTSVDWSAAHTMLRVEFPVAVHSPRANFEIQYGHLARPTHDNTSWDMAQFEVVGHRWADLSQPDYGVALLNDCKYGYRIKGGVMSLNLLRSPKSPDATADMGRHRFRYALLPHEGDHLAGEVIRRAAEFNVGAEVRATDAHRGSVPAVHSRMSVDVGHVVIDTVKQAEDGSGLVVRLFEAEGRDGRCTLTVADAVEAAYEVNLMEEQPSEIPVQSGHRIGLELSPFEITTLLLRPAR